MWASGCHGRGRCTCTAGPGPMDPMHAAVGSRRAGALGCSVPLCLSRRLGSTRPIHRPPSSSHSQCSTPAKVAAPHRRPTEGPKDKRTDQAEGPGPCFTHSATAAAGIREKRPAPAASKSSPQTKLIKCNKERAVPQQASNMLLHVPMFITIHHWFLKPHSRLKAYRTYIAKTSSICRY